MASQGSPAPGIFADDVRAWIMGGVSDPAAVPSPSNGIPIAPNGIYATASFTPAAAAYGAGDLIDVAKEFAFTYANGLAIPANSLIRILTSILRIDQTAIISGETSYTLQSYSVTPPSAQADNAAWTLASGDLPSYRGSLALGTPVDLGAACFVKTGGFTEDIRLVTSSMFSELVTAGAFTATAVARQVTLYGIVV